MNINITNSAGRSAVVYGKAIGTDRKYRLLTGNDEVEGKRILLGGSYGPPKDDISDLNLDTLGRYVADTSRGFRLPDGTLAKTIRKVSEKIAKDTGEVTEVAPTVCNVNTETPLRWTGTFVSIDDAVGKFVFSHRIQLIHKGQLEYDFLYGIAKELSGKEALMLITQGKDRLVFNDGGLPYAAFLYGEVRGEMYRLQVLLTNQELKRP